jgi:hypothetical protein
MNYNEFNLIQLNESSIQLIFIALYFLLLLPDNIYTDFPFPLLSLFRLIVTHLAPRNSFQSISVFMGCNDCF